MRPLCRNRHMGGQKPIGFCIFWHHDCDRGVSFCNAIAKNPWVFAYFSITTAIGVSVFAMRLPKTHRFLHISPYKRNNAPSCCNTCSDSVLIKILCCQLIVSVNARLKNRHKTMCFARFLSYGSLSLSLDAQSDFHLNWNSFH